MLYQDVLGDWISVLFVCYILMLTLTNGQEVGSPDVCRNKTSSHQDTNRRFFDCLKMNYDYSLSLKRNTEVRFSYHLEDIFYSSFSGMYLTGMLVLEWQDDNFIWTEGNLSQIRSRKVAGLWKPEIYMNSLSNYDTDHRLFRSPIVSENSGGSVHILRTGRVYYMVQTILIALCPQQDLKYFPYDVQTCRIELFSFQNVSFKVDSDETQMFQELELPTPSYRILDYNISTGRGPGDKGGGNASSVFIRVKFARNDLMYWIKLYTPNLGLSVFLLIPFGVSPGHKLRLLMPTLAFLALLRQIQTLARVIPENRVYSGDILMLDFYRNLIILSLLILIHNFISCLLWRKKAFLPASLNRCYAKLYKTDACKRLTEVEAYFELEVQDSPEETPDNLETAFHTWSELLQLVDILLFLLVIGVEVYSFVPTLDNKTLNA